MILIIIFLTPVLITLVGLIHYRIRLNQIGKKKTKVLREINNSVTTDLFRGSDELNVQNLVVKKVTSHLRTHIIYKLSLGLDLVNTSSVFAFSVSCRMRRIDEDGNYLPEQNKPVVVSILIYPGQTKSLMLKVVPCNRFARLKNSEKKELTRDILYEIKVVKFKKVEDDFVSDEMIFSAKPKLKLSEAFTI